MSSVEATEPESGEALAIDTRTEEASGSGRAPTGAKRSSARRLLGLLGPGLVTGAADDDPSGIATYAQVGATFSNGML